MRTRPRTADDGFSLLEVVIAMLLLGLIAVAILPLAVSTVQLSVGNRENAAATAFASAELAKIRALYADDAKNDCADVDDYDRRVVKDPGNALSAEISVSCPTFGVTATGEPTPAASVATVTVRVYEQLEPTPSPTGSPSATPAPTTAPLVADMATQIVVSAP